MATIEAKASSSEGEAYRSQDRDNSTIRQREFNDPTIEGVDGCVLGHLQTSGYPIEQRSSNSEKARSDADTLGTIAVEKNIVTDFEYTDATNLLGDNETDGEKTPVPKFCVEGCPGDSSVTVIAVTSANPASNSDLNHLIQSCNGELETNAEASDGAEVSDGTGDCGSAPVSVQSSEDMKLSLVSWFSEPEENARECCKASLISRTTKKVQQRNSSAMKSFGDPAKLYGKSEEKENKTPQKVKSSSTLVVKTTGASVNQLKSQKSWRTQELFEKNLASVDSPKIPITSVGNNCSQMKKLECPRCARRSKSGTTTPAGPSKAPRRAVQSSKSNHELKKPIKSILKSDSRGSGSRSGSGSEKLSSMDSLGSASGIACIKSHPDSSINRSRCNFNSGSFSSSSLSPEEKSVAKLKRIEKYATLRLRKPRNTSGFNVEAAVEQNYSVQESSKGKSVGIVTVNPDIMSKSMSFLEKSSKATAGGVPLKRQGSLKIRRQSPMWEPSGTRTSALRMQKVQEAKNKTSGTSKNTSSIVNNSGSGDSIHTQSANTSYSGSSFSHSGGMASSGCANTNHKSANNQREKQLGAKVFSKLSSASGQTTSSAMKRIRQERGVQTDPCAALVCFAATKESQNASSAPLLDLKTYDEEHKQRLEILLQQYRAAALTLQQELEKSEEHNREMAKQLLETQAETNEMIDFLQVEKSMLAESLAETESEGKKWKEQVDSVKKEAQSRCSSLVRLSEQHKQEALKSQALLSLLESQSNVIICKQSTENSQAAYNIRQTRKRVNAVVEKLVKAYKVSSDVLASAAKAKQVGFLSEDTEINSSLLVPLISALLTGFPNPGMVELSAVPESATQNVLNCSTDVTTEDNSTSFPQPHSTDKSHANSQSSLLRESHDGGNFANSLQNLNQAIVEREAAERLIMEENIQPGVDSDGLDSMRESDLLVLNTEVEKLNLAIFHLFTVMRVVVVYCDKKVSCVTSDILQCLRSVEDDKVGSSPDIINVQKSLEAWNDAAKCRVTTLAANAFVENGHAGT